MKIQELTLTDLGVVMSQISKRMSKLEERTPENTKEWELLAYKRTCLIQEMNSRIEKIEFPMPLI